MIRSWRGFAMQKQIELADLGQRAAAVVDEVVRQHETYIVARDGRPEAVIVPYGEFERLRGSRVEALRAGLDRLERRLAELDGEDPAFESEITSAVAAGLPDVEARLVARRVLNSRLAWGPGDSTEIIREQRESRF